MRFWLSPMKTGTRGKGDPPKQPPWPPAFARRFADGGALRSIYEKPLGPLSNPLTDIRGNGGHFVLRSMNPFTPAMVVPGQTLKTFSPAGWASTVYWTGQQTLPLFDPNPATASNPSGTVANA